MSGGAAVCNSAAAYGCPRRTVFSQLPSAVISTVDHPLGCLSLCGSAAVCSISASSSV
jgi:hypothetical protein